MEFAPVEASVKLGIRVNDNFPKGAIHTARISLLDISLLHPAGPNATLTWGVSHIKAYKCNRKRYTLRVVIRSSDKNGSWDLDLVFQAPGAGDAAAANARALDLLGAAFLIGKRSTHIYKLFPDLSEADRQLQVAPGFEDVREEFLRLREVVPHHEFWARRIDVLAALRRHADNASTTSAADSLSLAKRRDLLLDRDSELRYAYRLLVPHRMSEQQFWQRVVEAQGGSTATRSVAQQVADSAGGQPFSMDDARRHLAREAGRLADGKGLAVGGDNALPSILASGGGAFGILDRDNRDLSQARLPQPGSGSVRDEQGNLVPARSVAEDIQKQRRERDTRLKVINSYSASELDAMGTAMAGVSGGANGKAPAQAGASGGADGAFAPMQASALARLSSADDAGAAAREGAVAQGAAVTRGMEEEDEDEEEEEEEEEEEVEGAGSGGVSAHQRSRSRPRVRGRGPGQSDSANGYVPLAAAGLEGVLQGPSITGQASAPAGSPSASPPPPPSSLEDAYAKLCAGLASCTVQPLRAIQNEQRFAGQDDAGTERARNLALHGFDPSQEAAAARDKDRDEGVLTLRKEVATVSDALRNGWACWSKAPQDEDCHRAALVIAKRLEAYRPRIEQLMGLKRGQQTFDAYEQGWQSLLTQVKSFVDAMRTLPPPAGKKKGKG